MAGDLESIVHAVISVLLLVVSIAQLLALRFAPELPNAVQQSVLIGGGISALISAIRSIDLHNRDALFEPHASIWLALNVTSILIVCGCGVVYHTIAVSYKTIKQEPSLMVRLSLMIPAVSNFVVLNVAIGLAVALNNSAYFGFALCWLSLVLLVLLITTVLDLWSCYVAIDSYTAAAPNSTSAATPSGAVSGGGSGGSNHNPLAMKSSSAIAAESTRSRWIVIVIICDALILALVGCLLYSSEPQFDPNSKQQFTAVEPPTSTTGLDYSLISYALSWCHMLGVGAVLVWGWLPLYFLQSHNFCADLCNPSRVVVRYDVSDGLDGSNSTAASIVAGGAIASASNRPGAGAAASGRRGSRSSVRRHMEDTSLRDTRAAMRAAALRAAAAAIPASTPGEGGGTGSSTAPGAPKREKGGFGGGVLPSYLRALERAHYDGPRRSTGASAAAKSGTHRTATAARHSGAAAAAAAAAQQQRRFNFAKAATGTGIALTPEGGGAAALGDKSASVASSPKATASNSTSPKSGTATAEYARQRSFLSPNRQKKSVSGVHPAAGGVDAVRQVDNWALYLASAAAAAGNQPGTTAVPAGLTPAIGHSRSPSHSGNGFIQPRGGRMSTPGPINTASGRRSVELAPSSAPITPTNHGSAPPSGSAMSTPGFGRASSANTALSSGVRASGPARFASPLDRSRLTGSSGSPNDSGLLLGVGRGTTNSGASPPFGATAATTQSHVSSHSEVGGGQMAGAMGDAVSPEFGRSLRERGSLTDLKRTRSGLQAAGPVSVSATGARRGRLEKSSSQSVERKSVDGVASAAATSAAAQAYVNASILAVAAVSAVGQQKLLLSSSGAGAGASTLSPYPSSGSTGRGGSHSANTPPPAATAAASHSPTSPDAPVPLALPPNAFHSPQSHGPGSRSVSLHHSPASTQTNTIPTTAAALQSSTSAASGATPGRVSPIPASGTVAVGSSSSTGGTLHFRSTSLSRAMAVSMALNPPQPQPLQPALAITTTLTPSGGLAATSSHGSTGNSATPSPKHASGPLLPVPGLQTRMSSSPPAPLRRAGLQSASESGESTPPQQQQLQLPTAPALRVQVTAVPIGNGLSPAVTPAAGAGAAASSGTDRSFNSSPLQPARLLAPSTPGGGLLQAGALLTPGGGLAATPRTPLAAGMLTPNELLSPPNAAAVAAAAASAAAVAAAAQQHRLTITPPNNIPLLPLQPYLAHTPQAAQTATSPPSGSSTATTVMTGHQQLDTSTLAPLPGPGPQSGDSSGSSPPPPMPTHAKASISSVSSLLSATSLSSSAASPLLPPGGLNAQSSDRSSVLGSAHSSAGSIGTGSSIGGTSRSTLHVVSGASPQSLSPTNALSTPLHGAGTGSGRLLLPLRSSPPHPMLSPHLPTVPPSPPLAPTSSSPLGTPTARTVSASPPIVASAITVPNVLRPVPSSLAGSGAGSAPIPVVGAAAQESPTQLVSTQSRH